jgi:hypothetical protein
MLKEFEVSIRLLERAREELQNYYGRETDLTEDITNFLNIATDMKRPISLIEKFFKGDICVRLVNSFQRDYVIATLKNAGYNINKSDTFDDEHDFCYVLNLELRFGDVRKMRFFGDYYSFKDVFN